MSDDESSVRSYDCDEFDDDCATFSSVPSAAPALARGASSDGTISFEADFPLLAYSVRGCDHSSQDAFSNVWILTGVVMQDEAAKPTVLTTEYLYKILSGAGAEVSLSTPTAAASKGTTYSWSALHYAHMGVVLKRLVESCCQMLNVPPTEMLLLLAIHNWDRERLENAWVEDNGEV